MAVESELTYERAFPGRFLKAGLFDGKNVTLTIENAFMEALEGEKGVENKLILAFVGRPMQLVSNKTNSYCLKEMFGNKVKDWVGKRVTFYPTKAQLGKKTVDCIRIYGSPDISEDVEIAARIGRKNFKATLHATKAVNPQPADPRIAAAWELLNWTKAEGEADMRNQKLEPAAYLAQLHGKLDQIAANEGAA